MYALLILALAIGLTYLTTWYERSMTRLFGRNEWYQDVNVALLTVFTFITWLGAMIALCAMLHDYRCGH